MAAIVGLHYTLAFGLELALLSGFGLFGYHAGGGGWIGGLLAAVLVTVAVLLWARFAAPRSATRLSAMPLLMFKLAIFAAGTVAFWAAEWTGFAIGFAVLAALDLAVAMALGRI